MSRSYKALLSTAVFLALALVAASKALADIVVVTGVNNQGTENVLLNPGTDVLTATGTVGSNNLVVNFTSASGSHLLNANPSGQATISGGTGNTALTQLSFSLANNATFSRAVYNINPSNSGSVLIHVEGVNITGGFFEDNFVITAGSQNFFTITAINGQLITSVALTAINGATFGDVRQVRLGGGEILSTVPAVTGTVPTNGATQVANNTNLSITFSEAVNVTGNWFQIVCGSSGTRNVADTVVTGGPTTFTINPNADFTGGESCTVTVFAAQVSSQNAGANMAANFVFAFTTVADVAPTIATTVPTNGATQVANNTNLTITFSEPVNVTGNWFQIVCSVSGTRNVADTVVTGGPTTFTVNPNVDFIGGETCTVSVFAAQVSDQDSNDPPDNMAANFVFAFTTVADVAPTVASTVPANGATQVANNANLTITFSEAVNVTGNWFQIVCGASGTRNVADTVVTGGPTTFTVNPNVDFIGGETCTVTVFAAQVSDQDANDPPDTMAANFVFSFQTEVQQPVVARAIPTLDMTELALLMLALCCIGGVAVRRMR